MCSRFAILTMRVYNLYHGKFAGIFLSNMPL
jgi:hypothetical protein